MSIYSRDSLKSAKAYISTLQNDAHDAQALLGSINNFCSSSTNVLQGESWNLVRLNLNDYISVFNLRKTLANDLASKISEVIDNMCQSLGNYPSIDTSKLEELQHTYDSCYAEISRLRSSKSEVDISNLMVQEGIMEDARKMIDQIKEVQRMETSCIAILNQLSDSLINYKSATGGVSIPSIHRV